MRVGFFGYFYGTCHCILYDWLLLFLYIHLCILRGCRVQLRTSSRIWKLYWNLQKYHSLWRSRSMAFSKHGPTVVHKEVLLVFLLDNPSLSRVDESYFFLSDIGSDRNWGSIWPMAFVSVPPFFCNIVYNLSNFVFYTELNARLPIVMIIKQLLDARVINFIQQTLTSSVTHETIDRLLRKKANHKIMIVEPKLKRTLFRSHFYNKISKQNALV